jgi:hypothetical protein
MAKATLATARGTDPVDALQNNLVSKVFSSEQYRARKQAVDLLDGRLLTLAVLFRSQAFKLFRNRLVSPCFREQGRLRWRAIKWNIIAEAEAGRYELHYAQQPPFGFFSGTYLGEISVCAPLFDPEAQLDMLKRRVADYPDALRQSVVKDYLWAAEFGLTAFAHKFALRSDSYGTAACLTRAVNQLVLVLFALNRKYLLNDKTAIEEIAEFERAPREFGARVQKTLAGLGSSDVELVAAVDNISQLLRETVEMSDGLYQPRYTLPK